jgi:hypothetical protein
MSFCSTRRRKRAALYATADGGVSQSAAKFAPGSKKIVRDFNAPPYQGSVAPGEIPVTPKNLHSLKIVKFGLIMQLCVHSNVEK